MSKPLSKHRDFDSNENVQKFRYGNKSKHDNLNDLMWDWFR